MMGKKSIICFVSFSILLTYSRVTLINSLFSAFLVHFEYQSKLLNFSIFELFLVMWGSCWLCTVKLRFHKIWGESLFKPVLTHTHVYFDLLTGCYISINFAFFFLFITSSFFLSLSIPLSLPVVSEVITRSFRQWFGRPGTLRQPLFFCC